MKLLLLLCLLPWPSRAEAGSCAAAARCCSGRDSSCIVTGSQPDGSYVDAPCYCDEGCLETSDCCRDYKEVCAVAVVDCRLSAWSEWSPCDTSCGKGVQSRKRVIEQHPSPAGTACGALEQKRGCEGRRCSDKYWRYKSPIRETAGLLPAKFWQRRRQGRKWDVRDNLFKRAQRLKAQANNNDVMHGYQADQPVNTSGRNDYCTVFELVKVTKACRYDKDFYKMKKDRQMCALCPEDARRQRLGYRCRGHGVDSRLTKWRSTVHPKCHGKWKRVYETDRCPCKEGADFIFV